MHMRDVNVRGWSGMCWNGSLRKAEWSRERIWYQEDGSPSIGRTARRGGEETVLVFRYQTEWVAFGVGGDVETAAAHLRTIHGVPMTLEEAIARWGDPLPTDAELAQLREQAQLTGRWPVHQPGPFCAACGAKRVGASAKKQRAKRRQT